MILFTGCDAPEDVPGAELKKEYRSNSSFADGDTIEYRCDSKHSLDLKDGHSWNRTCNNGKWSEIKFSCMGIPLLPIQCFCAVAVFIIKTF